ncbi:flagellar hook-associated protein FlgK [Exiguobacterium flavidum]|uniref:flagellar hook-associated protein FlgK n=1 Tax=Exiguobacterium flavidum TaxID=2184695 RepID=UPI000DF75299|nr:flagellar hook-associated protein FlgK [Exiguobacterium flavidum]
MGSTFMGLETGRRALTTHQWALQATGNNVANASTAGYSRQRLIMATTEQLTQSIGSGKVAQFGTGVRGEMIERMRDLMVDKQYRDESTKVGYYGAKIEAFGRMEDIINEPSDTGLAQAFDGFWESLETLSTNPQDSGARSVVRQKAETLSQTFNYMATSLEKVQGDIKSEIEVSVKKVNDLLEKIHNVNKQIHEIEPMGVLPNDLYDERDRYFDELSEYIDFEKKPIDTEAITSGNMGNAVKTAEGRVDIILKTPDPASDYVIELSKGVSRFDISSIGTATDFKVGTTTLAIKDGLMNGKLRGLLEMHGYPGSSTDVSYATMLTKLDTLASEFATAFNTKHKENSVISSSGATPTPASDFFAPATGATISAKTISLSSAIKASVYNIATSKDGNIGDSTGALALADVKKDKVIDGNKTTVGSYYQSMIGDMGVAADQVGRLGKNAAVLLENADQRRMSVSAVSIDEEMTLMIQYQHAYNAAARNITTVDEMLDKIINGMGLVGR